MQGDKLPFFFNTSKVSVLRNQIREDDFAVLERTKLCHFTHIACENEQLSKRKPCLNPVSSSQKQNFVDKKAKPVRLVENQCRKNAQDSESKVHVESPVPREKPDPILSVRVASSAGSSPFHGNSRCKLLKAPRESVTLESKNHSSGVVVKLPGIKGPLPDNHSVRVNETSVRGEADSLAKCTLNSLPEHKRNSNTQEDDIKHNEAGNSNMQATKKRQFPDSVVSESASSISIMPDVVVGEIGENLFWKSRRAIVDQQRVFEVQVFELHRLMEVQTLLSRSPELLEVWPSSEAIQMTEVPSERPFELPRKDHTTGNPQGKPPTAKIPLPPVNSDFRKDLFDKRMEQMAYPFCYLSAGNHWLAPVMSLSEGLVHKPYTGPSTPTAGGFIAPHHQGINASHSYFPPISLPVMNPSDNQFSMMEASFSQSYLPSLRNVAAVSQHGSKSLQLSDMQGSTGTSPGGPFTLFLFPMGQASDKAAGYTRSSDRPRGVIKVVPHNRRSASESASRIFRSIQEERDR